MMTNRPRPQTPAARRMSLNAKLKKEARERGVTSDPIRKQFVFALLYRRLFPSDDDRWMLLGGNALLLRTGGGRFTKDVDLSRAEDWSDEDSLRAELHGLVSRDLGDGFSMGVDRVEPHDHRDQHGYGTRSAKAYLRVTLAGQEFEKFTIDLSVRRHIHGPVDYVVPEPVIVHELLEDLPAVPVVPIENHTADKICALYESHRGEPSTRYRDLTDLVRIIQDLRIDACRLHEVLAHEKSRRKMDSLPDSLRSPHPSWETAYPRAAKDFAEFPPELHSLDASLRAAGSCLDEILSGRRHNGTWDPHAQHWTDGPTR